MTKEHLSSSKKYLLLSKYLDKALLKCVEGVSWVLGYVLHYLLNCKHEYYEIMHFFLGKFRQ